MNAPLTRNARHGVPIPYAPLCPPLGRRNRSPHTCDLANALFPVRIQSDVKARFLDFKPATHPGGTFPTGTMPCPRKTARHLTQRLPDVLRRCAAICICCRRVPPTWPQLSWCPPAVAVSRVRPRKAASPLTARMYSRCVSRMNRRTLISSSTRRRSGLMLLAHWGLLS